MSGSQNEVEEPARHGGYRSNNKKSIFDRHVDQFGIDYTNRQNSLNYLVIAFSAFMIAMSIVFAHLYSISATGNGTAYRVNNVTGAVSFCTASGSYCRILLEKNAE